MRLSQTIIFLSAAAALFGASPAAKESTYWSDYRGPGRIGHYGETAILTSWPAGGLDQLWKVEVGEAYSGITAAAGKVFTIEQRGKQETVAAYDFETGKEIWSVSWAGKYSSWMGGDGPRATPVWDGGRVYAQGAKGELHCLNADTGKVIWSGNIVADNGAKNVKWGTAATPLVVDGMLVTAPGGPNGKSVVAYDKLTGKVIWSGLSDKPSYASPMLVTLGGVRQVLVVNASGVVGLTPENGKELWRYPWETSFDVNAAQPVVVDRNRFLISSGYGHGSALVELTGGPERFETRTVWQNKNLKNKFNTSVLHDGYIYGLDETILTCLDVKTGERQWKGGRYGFGQVMLAGDHLVVTAETGEVALVKATPESHQEVERFQAVDGKTWNTPALAAGRLLVRSLKEMACYRIAPN